MDRATIESFVAPVYTKTPRNNESYRATYTFCKSRLEKAVEEYGEFTNNQQMLRLIRDDIDNLLRRYHEYCIKQRDGMGAHYVEVGADEDTDFEHLVPAARIRDMVIRQVISIDEALNCPTVKLSRTKHMLLKESGWGSLTPDLWYPFRRYDQVFEAEFQTFDGTPINTSTWTLEDHYRYFGYLTDENKN